MGYLRIYYFPLNKAGLIILLSIWFGFSAEAQLDPIRHAQNRMAKEKWEDTRLLLDKAIKRDSASVDARYVYSLLFFNQRYPSYHIDSANYYWHLTKILFDKTSDKEKGKLRKFPLDSIILFKLKSKIDSVAFVLAQSAHTEEGYIHFILNYGNAMQIPTAIHQRNEVAFVHATKINTHDAFQDFLSKYPNNHRSEEAKRNFDMLLFESSTKNKSLAEYQAFVEQNPGSPFYKEAFRTIFEMITLPGTVQSFEAIFNQYPGTDYATLSQKIIFHINLSLNSIQNIPDSLKEIYPLQDWIAFNENGLWGFMDEQGKTKLQPSLPDINAKYYCSPLTEDFIHTKGQLLTRNNALISTGNFSDILDLGSGFLLAKSDTTNFLIHKSGWKPLKDGVANAALISSRFLAIKKKSGWGLYSFYGQEILSPKYDRISELNGFILISNSGKEILVHPEKIIDYSLGKWEAITGDEIKFIAKKYFWVRNGGDEKLLDEKLNEFIPPNIQTISATPIGIVVKRDGLIRIKNWASLQDAEFTTLQIVEPWMITGKLGEKPTLFHVPTQKLIQPEADSIWFDQSFATVLRNDTLRLWQSASKSFTIPKSEKYSIRKGKDSSVYIFVLSKTRTTVHHPITFKKLFTTPFSDVQPILSNFFLIKDKGKQGLINEKGKILLKPEYDAILYGNGMFALLKNKKFGGYVLNSKKMISPTFDSNLLPYGKSWIMARKDKKLAFLKSDGAPHTAFEFDKIEYWSDSIAFVSTGGKRALYSIKKKKMAMENISRIQLLSSDRKEEIAIINQNSLYGMIGNTTGILINPEFEELTYQLVNSNLILIGIKPELDGKVEMVYLHSSGRVIKRETLPSKLAYEIVCDE